MRDILIYVRRGDVFRDGCDPCVSIHDDLEGSFTQDIQLVKVPLWDRGDGRTFQSAGEPAIAPIKTVPRSRLGPFIGRVSDEDMERFPGASSSHNGCRFQRLMGNAVRRGDVFFADLDTGHGSEQRGVRPVVVLQNDIGNIFSSTTIIAAMTSQKKSDQPTHVKVVFNDVPNVVLLEQIRTISKDRLIRYAGRLTSGDMEMIDRSVHISLAV